jgi:3-oxoacyl-[acyl-carrier protein] reductase
LTSAGGIDRHFAVNARASALLMREYLHRHIQRVASWGRIVSLTTSAGHAWNISYAASKNALVSYCLSAAEEMGKYGITVNVVRPGGTETGYITPEMEGQIVAQTALGRVGEPEDIADVILFLASKQGRWITGQVVTANGGVS